MWSIVPIGVSSCALMVVIEPTTGSANLLIQRSWTRRIGTGFRKWRFSRPTLGRHEVRLLQHAQVLHDPEARHLRQVLAQLTERLAIALEEPVEQDPPTGSASARKTGAVGSVMAADYM